MGLSAYEKLPKQELARSQLEVALRLYMQSEEYPAIITLAGAAEEVLGRLAESKELEPSLKKSLRELCEMFKEVSGNEAKETDFAQLRNRARNELKHLCSGNDLHMDFEREAAAMLQRALENYALCTGSRHPREQAFISRKVSNWRSKQA